MQSQHLHVLFVNNLAYIDLIYTYIFLSRGWYSHGGFLLILLHYQSCEEKKKITHIIVSLVSKYLCIITFLDVV